MKKATKGIAEELREMKVGDVVAFPDEIYKASTIRATPSQMRLERKQGWNWATRSDFKNGCTIVTRIS